MEKSSVQQVEKSILEWIEKNQAAYEDSFIVSLESLSSEKAKISIGDHTFNLLLEDGVPVEIECSKQKLMDWVQDCNEVLVQREIKSLHEGLSFVVKKYQKKMEADADIEDEEQDGDGWGSNDEMDEWDQQLNENQFENESQAYVKLVAQQQMEEQHQHQKKMGILGMGDFPVTSIINTKSVHIFQNSHLYQEITEAQQYLQKYKEQVKGWLNLVMIKEFLTMKFEIDLNYIEMNDSNSALMGFNLEEPLVVVLSGKETKFLNADEDLKQLDFRKAWKMGMLEFNCSNGQKVDSYACKVYVRMLVEQFIDTYLNQEGEEFKEHPELFKTSYPSQSNQKKGFFKALKGLFKQESVDDEMLAQLVEMGFDTEQARRALNQSKNDLIKALDILKEQSYDDQYEVHDSQDDSSISLPQTNNLLIQLLLFISDSLEKATRKCFICLQQLEGESLKLRTCTNDYCEYSFEESFNGQVYPELLYQFEEASLDICLTAKAIFSNRATIVMEPFPTFFLKKHEIRTKRGYLDNVKLMQESGKNVKEAKNVDQQNKDLEKMMKIFNLLPFPRELRDKSTSDESMREYLKTVCKNNIEDSTLAYKLLAYIFATNRTTIRELKPHEQILTPQEKRFRQFILTSSDPQKERIFMQNKKQHGSFFAWHGSSMENWFSILRNGLRNLSNSHMMTAGAAYGQGIYASANFQTSYGYSTRYSQGHRYWVKNLLQNDFLIGIVEIINKNEYKKDPTCNIVVVPQENDIILRYLFQYSGNIGSSYGGGNQKELNTLEMGFEQHYSHYIQALNKEKKLKRKQRIEKAYEKYQKRRADQEQVQKKAREEMKQRVEEEESKQIDDKLENMKQKVQGKGSAMATQRILIEYKGMLNSKDFKDIMRVDFVKDNIYSWRVAFDLDKYEITNELKEDFLDRKMRFQLPTEILYEVTFSDNYPLSPVFIRVIQPRFKYQTGHVTVGGSICMESLTPSGWTSARSVESYFVEILSLLNAGGARLDLANTHPYSLHEAQEAFNRVARFHGWIK